MKNKFYKYLFLVIFCFWISACSEYQKLQEDSRNQDTKEKIIIVKVPPFYDDKLSREENFWRYDSFLFPIENVPNSLSKDSIYPKRIPKRLPNYDALLVVSINENGKLKLNFEDEGNISETKFLTERLSSFFTEREKNGVYETGNWKVVKAVGIKTANSIKYEDFVKVVEAIKQSGAEPIVLLFDDDAGRELHTNLPTSKEIKK